MRKRILAVLALVLFLAGIVVFFASIATRHNEYAFYAAILIAPGALMALLQVLFTRRAEEEKRAQAQRGGDDHAARP